MMARFHVVVFRSLHSLAHERHTRRRKNARHLTNTQGVRALHLPEEAVLSLPEYVPLTGYHAE